MAVLTLSVLASLRAFIIMAVTATDRIFMVAGLTVIECTQFQVDHLLLSFTVKFSSKLFCPWLTIKRASSLPGESVFHEVRKDTLYIVTSHNPFFQVDHLLNFQITDDTMFLGVDLAIHIDANLVTASLEDV